MKDLKRILIVRYTLIIAAVLIAISLLVIIPIRSFTLSQERKNLEEEAGFLATVSRRFFTEDISSQEIVVYLAELESDMGLRLMLIDTEGNILGDLRFPISESEDHIGRPEVVSALKGHVSSDIRESLVLDQRFIFAAAPVVVDSEIVGVACTALAVEDVTPVILQIWFIILVAFGVLLGVIIAVSVWTERTVLRDLRELGDAASDLAAGDLSRRVAEPGIRDFAELARSFNAMAEQVRRVVEETVAEGGKLEAVLDNISAGVMVTDSESKIILINPSAEKMLGIEMERNKGRRIIEAFSSSELDLMVARAMAGEEVDGEIELVYPRKAVLHVKANPVTGPDGSVVASVSAIEDITELKRVNRMRQDFVANVSHELRTPVATVKALTDTLLAGAWEDSEKRERFLDDLDRETARLSQLIEDLLALNRLESQEEELRLEEIDVPELMRECLHAKKKLAQKYGVALEASQSPHEVSVRGDRRLLRTALNNLVDNAIKYNREGGRVAVACEPEDGGVSIEVSDTGIGMPREELPRIFERFYRIDKARSRETGGTGLGLSIVRHIVEQHGGYVTVDSIEGEGSVFRMHVPCERSVTEI